MVAFVRTRTSHRSRPPSDSRGSRSSSSVAVKHLPRIVHLSYPTASLLFPKPPAAYSIFRIASQRTHPLVASFRTFLPLRSPLSLVPLSSCFLHSTTHAVSTDRTTLLCILSRRRNRTEESEPTISREARKRGEQRDDRRRCRAREGGKRVVGRQAQEGSEGNGREPEREKKRNSDNSRRWWSPELVATKQVDDFYETTRRRYNSSRTGRQLQQCRSDLASSNGLASSFLSHFIPFAHLRDAN